MNDYWNQDRRIELRRIVERFNKKVSREIKKNPELAKFYPSRLSSKELQSAIRTTKDFNLLKRSVDRLFRKDAFEVIENELGLKYTKYVQNELKLGVKRINRAREKERERVKYNTLHEYLDLDEARILMPKELNYDRMDRTALRMAIQSIQKQSVSTYLKDRMELYKENYFRAIDREFGSIGQSLKDYLKNVSAEDMYYFYFQDPRLQLMFIYNEFVDDEYERVDAFIALWQESLGRRGR